MWFRRVAKGGIGGLVPPSHPKILQFSKHSPPPFNFWLRR